MEKRIKITALCGMGLGTSSLARMAIMDYVRSHGINAEVTVADIGSVRGLNSDIIITIRACQLTLLMTSSSTQRSSMSQTLSKKMKSTRSLTSTFLSISNELKLIRIGSAESGTQC